MEKIEKAFNHAYNLIEQSGNYQSYSDSDLTIEDIKQRAREYVYDHVYEYDLISDGAGKEQFCKEHEEIFNYLEDC